MRQLLSRCGPGWPTPEQAKAVAKNLPALDHPGGVAMSADDTGAQVGTCRRMWKCRDAGERVAGRVTVSSRRRSGSYEFLSMVAENFRRDGTSGKI